MSAATWWLVNTSPVLETNEPEPPELKRTDESIKCSSQPSSGAKPWALSSRWRGMSLKSHIPSSAETPVGPAVSTANVIIILVILMRTLSISGGGPTSREEHFLLPPGPRRVVPARRWSPGFEPNRMQSVSVRRGW